jgi:malonyl-CoA O-methyltransferase
MAEARFPEKRAVRRSFERAAATYDRHSVLQREVGDRLVAHLEGINIAPKRVLDLGCGTGAGFDLLASRFFHFEIFGLDIAYPMLQRARRRASFVHRHLFKSRLPRLVCGDAESLPLATGSMQLVFSNLALQWCRPDRVFPEAARVLESEGLFIFSTFGPDTLKELRAAFAKVDAVEHVNTFIDMHDLGDALVHAGFADPVMEMEVVTLEYSTVRDVARDLQAIGARNSMPGRPRGLGGRRHWERVVEAYESHRRDGVLPATYEVIYGHAWKVPPKKTADGRQVIGFVPRGAR